MKPPGIFVRLAQFGLRRVAVKAEELDQLAKAGFREAGFEPPEKTRGQEFVRTVRGYANRLEKHLESANKKR